MGADEMKTRTTASEAEISRAIMDYLAARHVFAMRMNSGTRIGSYKGKNWAIHMHEPGTADILAFPTRHSRQIRNGKFMTVPIPGIPLWIEVKDATGKQSEIQKSFQAQVESHGHQYIVARSIEDVEEALR
jgi:hypothetical protein